MFFFGFFFILQLATTATYSNISYGMSVLFTNTGHAGVVDEYNAEECTNEAEEEGRTLRSEGIYARTRVVARIV